MYKRALTTPSRKTGAPLAAASHRCYLWTARRLFTWAAQQGCIGLNPFRDVAPTGKVNAGKPQLRIDEARRFTDAALACFEETGQPLAIGALVALMRGLGNLLSELSSPGCSNARADYGVCIIRDDV